MNDINLLPQVNENRSSAMLQFAAAIFIILTALSAAVIFGYIMPVKEKQDCLEQLRVLEQESETLPQADYSREDLNQEYSDLKAKALLFSEIGQSTPSQWRAVLAALVDSLPDSTYISGFSCEGTNILLAGTSKDDVTSVEYARNLKSTNQFKEITMENITYQNDIGKVSFKMSCIVSIGGDTD